jgi:hypothetical protein
MSRMHVHRAALALICTQVLQLSPAAAVAQTPVPLTPPPRITLPAPGPTVDTVGEYYTWLSGIPLRTGDVWVVEGDAYRPSADGHEVAEMSAKPGSTIGAADRVFLRIQPLDRLWAKALAWITAVALGAALISAATAIRFQREVGQLRKELSELRGARGY